MASVARLKFRGIRDETSSGVLTRIQSGIRLASRNWAGYRHWDDASRKGLGWDSDRLYTCLDTCLERAS